MNNVLQRVNNYWKKDIKKGIQYKVIVSISKDFESESREEIQDAIFDSIDEIANKSKENAMTKLTIDYNIWCDVEEYTKTRTVWRNLRKAFNNAETNGTITYY